VVFGLVSFADQVSNRSSRVFHQVSEHQKFFSTFLSRLRWWFSRPITRSSICAPGSCAECTKQLESSVSDFFAFFYLTSHEACEAGQSFLCFHRQILVRIGEVLFHSLRCWLFRSYVECATRPWSAPPVAPVSSPRLSRVHKPLALGPCHPSCLDSFFLPRLIWCMLLIRVCLAPMIHTSSEQRAPNTDFPRCFLLSPTELSLAICF
jgi:hypothetical protein